MIPAIMIIALSLSILVVLTHQLLPHPHPSHACACDSILDTDHRTSCNSDSPPTIPHADEHCSARGATEQVRTVQAIEIAVEEARFRRWGEEQGWSECRMGMARAEVRERLLRKAGWVY